jgi:hypothetical protein
MSEYFVDQYRHQYLLIFTKSTRYRYFYIHSIVTYNHVWVFRWSVPAPVFIDFHKVDPVPILLHPFNCNLHSCQSIPLISNRHQYLLIFTKSTRYRYFYFAHSVWILFFLSVPVPLFYHFVESARYRYFMPHTQIWTCFLSVPVPSFIDYVESTRYQYFYIARSNLNLLYVRPVLLFIDFTKSIRYRYFRSCFLHNANLSLYFP